MLHAGCYLQQQFWKGFYPQNALTRSRTYTSTYIHVHFKLSILSNHYSLEFTPKFAAKKLAICIRKFLARVFGFCIIPVKTHGHVSKKMHSTQSAIYRKQKNTGSRKIADFNPLYLLNYLADFYQTYIFYAPHIHDLTYQI